MGHVRVAVAVVVLLQASSLGAQTASNSSDALAARLLSTVPRGQEHTVACDGLDADAVTALIALGRRVRLRSIDDATRAYRLAERAGRCAGSDALLGAALNELSTAVFAAGNVDAARATANESVRIHERLNDPSGLGIAWWNVGVVDWWIEDMDTALAEYRRSLDLLTKAGNREGQARVLNSTAFVYRFFGDFATALDYLTRALALFEEVGERRRAATVTDNIAIVHFNRGEYATALDWGRRALAMARAIDDQEIIGKCLDTLGDTYRVLGAYDQGLTAFQEALQLRTSVGSRPGVMETTQNIGVLHFARGDYELAIAAYRQALRYNRRWDLRDGALVAEALRNVGAAAWRLGQRDRAVANFRESLDVARREGMRAREGELLNDLGQMALARGRLAESTRLLTESLSIRRSIGAQAGITETLTSLASTRLASGRDGKALELAREAVDNAVTHDQLELLWAAQTVAGIAYRHLHRAADARRAFTEAIRSIDRLSTQVTGAESLRLRFFEDKLSPYHELMSLSIEQGAFGEALELADRSKARLLTRLLLTSRDDRVDALSADERREQARLRDAVQSLNKQIEREQDKKAPDQVRLLALETDRRIAREQASSFDAALAARHPELAAVQGDVAPLQLLDATKIVADRGTAIVEFVAGARQVYAFVVSSGGQPATVAARAVDGDPAALAARVERFRREVASRDFGFADDARALYRTLLGPFETQLARASRVIVVPDGILWTLPFQALLGPRGYVIETAAVSYAPSIAALREMERLPTPSGRRSLFAMAKARFTGHSLEPLPDAEAQVRLLRDVYGADRSETYFGDDATESRFKAGAPHYAIVHLATHGILDEASPLYSHLVLSASPDDPGDDGRLDAREIMRMKLPADLVVLAACDMGRGRIAPGEGVVGTMWALFAAGTRSMVVGQFSVESKSATSLLVAFHRRIAAASGSKAAHLRAAALEVLHTPRYAHPYYWAGFILVGAPE